MLPSKVSFRPSPETKSALERVMGKYNDNVSEVCNQAICNFARKEIPEKVEGSPQLPGDWPTNVHPIKNHPTFKVKIHG